MMNRRGFARTLAGLGALTAGAATGCAAGRERSADGLRILDTHTHFYDPRRPEGVPWPPPDDPVLYRPVLPDEFSRLSRPLGVVGTVVVEASPRVSDNDWLLDLARTHPAIVGIVGHLKPGRPGFREDLDRLAANPLFRGIRTGGWDVALQPGDRAFLRDLEALASRDLTLDVLVGPSELDKVAALSEALPDLRIVIDHCGNVPIRGQEPPEDWRRALTRCGRRGRIAMKASGLVEGTGRTDGTAPEAVAPYKSVLDSVWSEFGPTRILFGSNWPVSARFASYATVTRLMTAYAKSLRPAEARALFFDNAVRVYGLDRAGRLGNGR